MAVICEEISYPAANGKDTICAQIWRSDVQQPRYILQIVHGMCEYMGRYTDFASFLAEKGVLVCGNDHAGHGKSKGADGYGYFADRNGDRNLISDVRKMNETIRKLYPGLPVVVLGHSLGSFICRSSTTQYGEELAGIILSGTAGDNPQAGIGLFLAKAICLFCGPKHRSPLLSKMAFGTYNSRYPEKRTPYDWISRDTAVVDRYAADPQCTYLFTASAFADLLKLCRSISGDAWARKVPKDKPYYILSGSLDPVGGYAEGTREVCSRLERAGVTDMTVRIYEGGHHEMLNETNHTEVWDDLAAWLDKTAGIAKTL